MAEEHPIISDINTHFQEVVLTKNNLNWRLKETAAAATNSLPHSMAPGPLKVFK